MKNKLLLCLIVEGFFITLVESQYYLNDGVAKFIVGLGVPVDVAMSGGSLSWFTNVQVFYKLPDNISYYEPYQIMQKRSVKNTFNRYNLYQALTNYFKRLGFSGSECIYRLICEISKNIQQIKQNSGIVGKIIYTLFSPWNDLQQGLEKHKLAQWQGLHNNSNCELIYNDCEVEEDSVFLS